MKVLRVLLYLILGAAVFVGAIFLVVTSLTGEDRAEAERFTIALADGDRTTVDDLSHSLLRAEPSYDRAVTTLLGKMETPTGFSWTSQSVSTDKGTEISGTYTTASGCSATLALTLARTTDGERGIVAFDYPAPQCARASAAPAPADAN